MDGGASPKRFRFRVIPTTLLVIFGCLSTAAIGAYLIFAIYTEVQSRWLHPDPGYLELVQDRQLSPQIIAAFSCCAMSTYFALVAAVASFRGDWRPAARRMIWLVMFLLLMAYVGFFPESHWK
ncbi:MAG TPA: hypothetical protein VH107_14530 [Lacipirellulaceae bacterium]|jgi:hypothetical protein|nr:hypothetical protein [Lacipirellulaceae bacterium]